MNELSFLMAGIIIGILSVVFSFNMVGFQFQADVIKHECAQYNNKTGKFEWLTQPEKE